LRVATTILLLTNFYAPKFGTIFIQYYTARFEGLLIRMVLTAYGIIASKYVQLLYLKQPFMEKQITPNEVTTGPVQKNIEAVLKLEKEALQNLSPVEHLAEKVTSFAGSTPFLIFHVLWFTAWIILNSHIFSKIHPFDPFPFSFLTLMVSLEAIFLTLLVLMSQNRMTKEADKRAHLDLQINLLDEQETTMILRMVQKISKHLGLEEEIDESLKDLCEPTDIDSMAKKLDENAGIK
jgi:uncharacterized membrane protein